MNLQFSDVLYIPHYLSLNKSWNGPVITVTKLRDGLLLNSFQLPRMGNNFLFS